MTCKNCGCEVKSGAQFCTNCGSSVTKQKRVKSKIVIPIIALLMVFVVALSIVGVMQQRESRLWAEFEADVMYTDEQWIKSVEYDASSDRLRSVLFALNNFENYKDLVTKYDAQINLYIYESGAVVDYDSNEPLYFSTGEEGAADGHPSLDNQRLYCKRISQYRVVLKNDLNNNALDLVEQNSAGITFEEGKIYNFMLCIENTLEQSYIAQLLYNVPDESRVWKKFYSYFRYENSSFEPVYAKDLTFSDVVVAWYNDTLYSASYNKETDQIDLLQEIRSRNN
ncbi:MAG: hypothetical protein KH282_01045 [Clostridiales bacterium]|nr:hypothetical protein [Clostridiales bacterium]